MFKISRNFAALLFIAFFVPAIALAQTPTPVNIAVVDMQKLLTESSGAKDIQKQMNAYKETFLGEIAKQEQGLRAEEKELSGQQGKIEKPEFEKKVKAFEKKLLDTRRDAQTKKKKLDDALAKSVGTLREEIYKVVQAIADEKKFNLVITRQNVVIGANSLDITNEALKRLNKAISKIKVDMPQ